MGASSLLIPAETAPAGRRAPSVALQGCVFSLIVNQVLQTCLLACGTSQTLLILSGVWWFLRKRDMCEWLSG